MDVESLQINSSADRCNSSIHTHSPLAFPGYSSSSPNGTKSESDSGDYGNDMPWDHSLVIAEPDIQVQLCKLHTIYDSTHNSCLPTILNGALHYSCHPSVVTIHVVIKSPLITLSLSVRIHQYCAIWQWSYVLPIQNIQVTTITEKDNFLLVACDGLFDVFTGEDVVKFVKENMEEHGDAQKCCHNLTHEAIKKRHSRDNVSVILIILNKWYWFERASTAQE